MHEAYTKNIKNTSHYAVQWEDEQFGWHFVSVKNLRNTKGVMADSYSAGETVLYRSGKKEYNGKVLSKSEAPIEKTKKNPTKKNPDKENSKKPQKAKTKAATRPAKKPVVQPQLQVTSPSKKLNDARFKKFMKCLNAVFDKYQLQDIAIDTVTLDFQSSYPEYEENEIADYLLEMEEQNQLMITDKRIYKVSP